MKTPEFVSVGVAICIRGIGLSCLATACAPPRGQAVGAGCRRRGSWPPADWLRLGSQDVAAVVPGTAPGGHGGLVGGIGAVQGQYIARAVGVAGDDDVGPGLRVAASCSWCWRSSWPTGCSCPCPDGGPDQCSRTGLAAVALAMPAPARVPMPTSSAAAAVFRKVFAPCYKIKKSKCIAICLYATTKYPVGLGLNGLGCGKKSV